MGTVEEQQEPDESSRTAGPLLPQGYVCFKETRDREPLKHYPVCGEKLPIGTNEQGSLKEIETSY